MDKSYAIERSDGITTIRFSGKIVASEYRSAFLELNGSYPSGKRLWDLRCGLDCSAAELEDLAILQKSLTTEAIKAAILVADDLTFGLIRMYLIYRRQDHVEISVFRSETEALNWLSSG